MQRAHLIARLYAELVGPRQGSAELLPPTQSPRDEYIVGSLEPEGADDRDPEADADDMGEAEGDTGADDDEGGAGDVACTTSVSPSLTPKSLAHSIGLSFTVAGDSGEPTTLSVCATWGRYQQDALGFRRKPEFQVLDNLAVGSDAVARHPQGVEIHVRCTQPARGLFRVSVFLRNRIVVADPKRVAIAEYVFQPEIRVCLSPNARLMPLGAEKTQLEVLTEHQGRDSEDAVMDLLYRGRAGFARGHLCGAVWDSIDPERPHQHGLKLELAPFAWTDKSIVPAEAGLKFEHASVRSALLPLYPVQTAEMEWRGDYGPAPELDPEVLCELWTPASIERALGPLPSGYARWLEQQEAKAAEFEGSDRDIAIENLRQCRRALERLKSAISCLVRDEDARLAFAFANKAIKMQARWANRNLKWRPFQLAFLLLNVRGLCEPTSADRDICDLLWFPTGGGKTEAYLGLTAFTLAFRRRRALRGAPGWGPQGGGPGVLSRYTLRLLTIQQFRRALGVLLAAEILRVSGLDNPAGNVGWRPKTYSGGEQFLWGGQRFSTGLWVGGEVTPNSLRSLGPLPINRTWKYILGALDILQGASAREEYLGNNPTLRINLSRNGRGADARGEPAQITQCPCCHSILAIADGGLQRGRHILRFLIRADNPTPSPVGGLNPENLPLTVLSVDLAKQPQGNTWIVTAAIEVSDDPLTARQIDEWWYRALSPALGPNVRLLAARPARLGYFICTYDNSENLTHQCDFEIYCLNDACDLNVSAWAELVPLPRNMRAPRVGGSPVTRSVPASSRLNGLPGFPGAGWQELPEPFRHSGATPYISNRIPISALTVDEQLYHRCPSLVIGTVDKFARLAYEGKSAGVFGNVDHFHSRAGYYRVNCPPSPTAGLQRVFHPHPSGAHAGALHVPVEPFRPPDLVLQDELHLIEGPLGSMVGLYETAVDHLCTVLTGTRQTRPKYAASTATARQAASQVRALFDRELFQFPPVGITAEDRFFSLEREIHPFDDDAPGRLYLGVSAPGRGAQTPIVRIWSLLLQAAFEDWSAAQTDITDQFFTLVGYFNANREFAGAVSLYRQDIPERMTFRFGQAARPLHESHLELSGTRTSSLDLPTRLAQLEARAPGSPSAVFATSMFGTGVDVGRLGLMVVNGQPKNTASYIQATGRVGRRNGGLVVTFLRASRPRDLDHYEYFTAYHRAISRFIEPVTVAPFSARARERALGPLAVVLLRQARAILGHRVDDAWRTQERLQGAIFSEARRMATARHDREVRAIAELVERRAQSQPDGRRPNARVVEREANSELDRWAQLARTVGTNNDVFVYSESAFLNVPVRHVVLGDAQHTAQGLQQAFRHSPQSLREVEEITGFKT